MQLLCQAMPNIFRQERIRLENIIQKDIAKIHI